MSEMSWSPLGVECRHSLLLQIALAVVGLSVEEDGGTSPAA